MVQIANILTNGNFEDELYNVTSKKEGLIAGIPTLVIGWEFCKKCYGDVDILDRKIDEMTYWTYGKREKRDRYDETISWFKDFAIKRLIKSIEYKFINVITISGESKDSFYGIFEGRKPTSYFSGEMCYVNRIGENRVYGFSLRDFRYIGVDTKKIVSFVYSNSVVVNKNDNLSQENKTYFNCCKYVMPYILS
jgi:hypothetical protein